MTKCMNTKNTDVVETNRVWSSIYNTLDILYLLRLKELKYINYISHLYTHTNTRLIIMFFFIAFIMIIIEMRLN